MLDHFFPLLFPKDSESLKILNIRLREGWAKRRLNGTSKVNTRTDGQTDGRTDRQTDGQTDGLSTYGKHQPRADALKICNFGPQGPQNAALQQRYSPC